MKFIVIDNPKFIGFFLRRMFGIKKLKEEIT
ncbi:MAG: stage V sporulation protein SpoVM [Lachnospiraceae bacterium]|nr:stage V sporulation protein SpoVM [Lachnospiraceae bacterium]